MNKAARIVNIPVQTQASFVRFVPFCSTRRLHRHIYLPACLPTCMLSTAEYNWPWDDRASRAFLYIHITSLYLRPTILCHTAGQTL